MSFKNLESNDVFVYEADSNQEEMFRNLMNLQFHDLSEYRSNFEIGYDGRFPWTYDGIFKNDYYYPLLISYKGKIVGNIIFADFKGKHENVDYQLAELFVLKMYRRKSIGKQSIKMLFDNFKGKYHLDVASKNEPAMKFWNKLISEYGKIITEKVFIEDGCEYINYIFEIV